MSEDANRSVNDDENEQEEVMSESRVLEMVLNEIGERGVDVIKERIRETIDVWENWEPSNQTLSTMKSSVEAMTNTQD